MSVKKVIEFYDPFYAKQENVVINDRLFSLCKRAKNAGIRTNSSLIVLGNTQNIFITLCDVLEHIPLTNHDQLFARVATFMHKDSVLLINIPNPRHIE